jgi:hypothetical protein
VSAGAGRNRPVQAVALLRRTDGRLAASRGLLAHHLPRVPGLAGLVGAGAVRGRRAARAGTRGVARGDRRAPGESDRRPREDRPDRQRCSEEAAGRTRHAQLQPDHRSWLKYKDHSPSTRAIDAWWSLSSSRDGNSPNAAVVEVAHVQSRAVWRESNAARESKASNEGRDESRAHRRIEWDRFYRTSVTFSNK